MEGRRADPGGQVKVSICRVRPRDRKNQVRAWVLGKQRAFLNRGRETELNCYLLFFKQGKWAPPFTSSGHSRQTVQPMPGLWGKPSRFHITVFTNELTIC